MSTPLKVRDGDGNIQEFTTAEENYLAYQIGLQLLDDSANGFGSLTKNDSADTAVGTFTNTFFNEPVGTHPSTSITTGSTTSFLSQSLGSAAETDSDVLLPLKWIDSSLDGPAGFRQFGDTDLNTAVDRYLTTIFTNDYPGSFYLADAAPSGDYSIHLANVFTDTRTDGTSIPYNVYRRNTMTAPTTVRPMFVEDSAGGSGMSIREMNDRQIKFSFGQRAKTRIGTSKIGTYQLRSSTAGAPTDPGTWVAKGTATDTKQTTSQQTYNTDSTVPYQAIYTKAYTNPYTSNYTATYESPIYVPNYTLAAYNTNYVLTYTRGGANVFESQYIERSYYTRHGYGENTAYILSRENFAYTGPTSPRQYVHTYGTGPGTTYTTIYTSIVGYNQTPAIDITDREFYVAELYGQSYNPAATEGETLSQDFAKTTIYYQSSDGTQYSSQQVVIYDQSGGVSIQYVSGNSPLVEEGSPMGIKYDSGALYISGSYTRAVANTAKYDQADGETSYTGTGPIRYDTPGLIYAGVGYAGSELAYTGGDTTVISPGYDGSPTATVTGYSTQYVGGTYAGYTPPGIGTNYDGFAVFAGDLAGYYIKYYENIYGVNVLGAAYADDAYIGLGYVGPGTPITASFLSDEPHDYQGNFTPGPNVVYTKGYTRQLYQRSYVGADGTQFDNIDFPTYTGPATNPGPYLGQDAALNNILNFYVPGDLEYQRNYENPFYTGNYVGPGIIDYTRNFEGLTEQYTVFYDAGNIFADIAYYTGPEGGGYDNFKYYNQGLAYTGDVAYSGLGNTEGAVVYYNPNFEVIGLTGDGNFLQRLFFTANGVSTNKYYTSYDAVPYGAGAYVKGLNQYLASYMEKDQNAGGYLGPVTQYESGAPYMEGQVLTFGGFQVNQTVTFGGFYESLSSGGSSLNQYNNDSYDGYAGQNLIYSRQPLTATYLTQYIQGVNEYEVPSIGTQYVTNYSGLTIYTLNQYIGPGGTYARTGGTPYTSTTPRGYTRPYIGDPVGYQATFVDNYTISYIGNFGGYTSNYNRIFLNALTTEYIGPETNFSIGYDNIVEYAVDYVGAAYEAGTGYVSLAGYASDFPYERIIGILYIRGYIGTAGEFTNPPNTNYLGPTFTGNYSGPGYYESDAAYQSLTYTKSSQLNYLTIESYVGSPYAGGTYGVGINEYIGTVPVDITYDVEYGGGTYTGPTTAVAFDQYVTSSGDRYIGVGDYDRGAYYIAGRYEQVFVGGYVGPTSFRGYTNTYATYDRRYTGNVDYIGTYIGQSFAGFYDRDINYDGPAFAPATYTGAVSYTSEKPYQITISYTPNYIRNVGFTGNYINYYQRTFTANINYAGNYVRTIFFAPGAYARNYVRNLGYNRNYARYYVRSSSFGTFSYLRTYARLWIRALYYVRNFTGAEPSTITVNFTGIYNRAFPYDGDLFRYTRQTTVNYTRTIGFTGVQFNIFPNYTSPTSYTRDVGFVGSSYTGTYTRQISYQYKFEIAQYLDVGSGGDGLIVDDTTRFSPVYILGDREYITNYDREGGQGASYTGSYTIVADVGYAGGSGYVNTYTLDFASATGFIDTFEDPVPYVSIYTVNYTTDYATDYIGNYIGNFEGETIDATDETIETYTLYVRIA